MNDPGLAFAENLLQEAAHRKVCRGRIRVALTILCLLLTALKFTVLVSHARWNSDQGGEHNVMTVQRPAITMSSPSMQPARAVQLVTQSVPWTRGVSTIQKPAISISRQDMQPAGANELEEPASAWQFLRKAEVGIANFIQPIRMVRIARIKQFMMARSKQVRMARTAMAAVSDGAAMALTALAETAAVSSHATPPPSHDAAGKAVSGAASLATGNPKGPMAKLWKLKTDLIEMFKTHGPLALAFHFSVWSLTLGTCFLLLSMGLQVEYFLPAEWQAMLPAGTGNLALSLAITEVTGPFRTLFTLVVVPMLSKKLGFLKRAWEGFLKRAWKGGSPSSVPGVSGDSISLPSTSLMNSS